MVAHPKYTAADFDQMIALPENVDKRLELIGSRVVEAVSNNYSSETAANLLAEIKVFAKRRSLGRVTGANGGYMVAGERYIPDVAFISFERQPEPSYAAYNPQPPDLVVEVLSPSDDEANLRIKIVNYLRVGTIVWVVDPVKKLVEVYVPDESPQTLAVNDILDGGSVLPGFEIPVNDIFPE
jgi:Uma2 family endonuclease